MKNKRGARDRRNPHLRGRKGETQRLPKPQVVRRGRRRRTRFSFREALWLIRPEVARRYGQARQLHLWGGAGQGGEV